MAAVALQRSATVDHWRSRAEGRIVISLAGRSAERRARRPDSEGWRRIWSEEELRGLHEAAHAVTSWLYGLQPCGIVLCQAHICTVNGIPGRVINGFASYSRDPVAADDDALALPASVKTDYRSAAEECWLLCSSFGWRDTLGHMRRLRQRADELVEGHWRIIRILAGSLCVKKRLKGSEIRRILDGQIPSFV